MLLGLVVGCDDSQLEQPAVPISELRQSTVYDKAGSDPVFRAVDAVFGDSGLILVLDQLAPTVHVFDVEGEHLHKIGSQGAGPGEFIRPSQLDYLASSGLVAVSDEQLGRVLILERDGNHVASLARMVPGAHSMRWSAMGHIYYRAFSTTREGPTASLEAFDPMSEEQTDIASTPVSLRRSGGSRSSGAPCVDCPMAISRSGVFAFAPDVDDYRITLLPAAAATQPWEISGIADPIPYTAAERDAVERTRSDIPAHLRMLMPARSHHPIVIRMQFDNHERLWVQIGTAEGSMFDVYDADGSLQRKVRISRDIMLLDVLDDSILGLFVDEVQGPVVARFTLAETT